MSDYLFLVADQLERSPVVGAGSLPLHVESVDDAEVVERSVAPQITPEFDRAGCLDELVRAIAESNSPTERKFWNWLHSWISGNKPVPRSGYTYCMKTMMLLAGIDYADFVRDHYLRSNLRRIVPSLPLEPFQAPQRRQKLTVRENSVIGLLRAHLQKMADEKRPLRPYGSSGHISLAWLADDMGIRRSQLKRISTCRQEVRDWIPVLGLGEPFVDDRKPNREQRRAYQEALSKVIAKHLKEGRPFQADPERSDKIYFEPLFEEAGVEDLVHRDVMTTDDPFRKELAAAIRVVSLSSEVGLPSLELLVTYGHLLSDEGGAKLVRAKWRTEHPGQPADCKGEREYLANERWALRRFMRYGTAIAQHDEDDALPAFKAKSFDNMVARAMPTSRAAKALMRSSLQRWCQIAAALEVSIDLPPLFNDALDLAMRASKRDAQSIAEKLGCNRRLIYDWRVGRCGPTYENEDLLPLLEKELGVPAGTFVERVKSTANSRISGRKQLTIFDGTKTVQLGSYWRYLEKGAARWPDDVLRPAVEDVHRRHFNVQTPHSVRSRAARLNHYELPEVDPACPIFAEFDDLVGFKRSIIGDDRLQMPGAEWGRWSAKIARERVELLSRWLMLSVDKGGAGLEAHQVAFSLILNVDLMIKYVVWRVRRAEKLTVHGREIGPRIVSTETQFLQFLAMLVNMEFGWLTQSQNRVSQPVHIPTRFTVPRLQPEGETLVIVEDETCKVSEVMPASVAARAKDEWLLLCLAALRHYKVYAARFGRAHKLIRDPHELVMPILRHKKPLAVVMHMVRRALQHARRIETAPYLHAKDYAKALAMLLLLLLVFRSETLRDLTWREDGTGNLRTTEDGTVEIRVGAEAFKNVRNTSLFGPTWRRRDYHRFLGDFGGLEGVLRHYLEHCRPLLVGACPTDLLFPPPSGQERWSHGSFYAFIAEFTRKWCVYNRRYDSGMVGVSTFGPHVCRDIVATHIIRNSTDEDRWERAARVLCTGVEQVKLRYGFVVVAEELAQLDPLLAEASECANVDERFY